MEIILGIYFTLLVMHLDYQTSYLVLWYTNNTHCLSSSHCVWCCHITHKTPFNHWSSSHCACMALTYNIIPLKKPHVYIKSLYKITPQFLPFFLKPFLFFKSPWYEKFLNDFWNRFQFYIAMNMSYINRACSVNYISPNYPVASCRGPRFMFWLIQ